MKEQYAGWEWSVPASKLGSNDFFTRPQTLIQKVFSNFHRKRSELAFPCETALDSVPNLAHHAPMDGSVPIKHVVARFYLTTGGANPMRDWLMRLPVLDRKQVGHDIRDVEFGWPVGMPLCKSLGDGLWEIRSDLPSRRIARVLFCVIEGELLLLHGFIKKTQKTPPSDLKLARKRMKEAKR